MPLDANLSDRRAARIAGFDLTPAPGLPVSEHADEIASLLNAHQVVIVAGETGSGKTTQIPKICMAAGFGVRGAIAHTQPRRLAARSVAARISEEVGTALGDGVGYAVRFDDKVADDTVVKLITDGLLLTEVRHDRALSRYEVIIVDEAHERSLNIDFLLGVLRRLVARRPELRVIVTSATIDVERFSAYFGGAPVVSVSGRGYPVDMRYLPAETLDGAVDPEVLLVDAVREALALPAGAARDILVFQSGEREIFDSARALREQFGTQLDILPLYARLRAADQAQIFRPGKRRRVVLATNVAETSLTVPNIGFVIDPGYARINRYSYRSKLERLPVEPISQASANQRAGRCGRVAPGVCLRLYTRTDFESRPEFSDPEIRRVNLASVVLTMRAYGLGDIQRFGFIEPPDPRAVKDAVRLLEELGALRENRLTNIGRAMSRLPVDPRLARMLVAASSGHALAELLIITSALAVQDPRERPFDARAAADAKHERFIDEASDFGTLLNLWAWLGNLHEATSRSGERKAIVSHFLNPSRVREWRALHRQLLLAVKQLGWRINQVPAGRDEVNRAVLAGSLSLIGLHDEKGVYLGARGTKFRIFPGSALHGRTPKWVAAADIAETARVYARTVCEVQPGWIESHAGHLVKRQHAEPHWSAATGQAKAYERVTLYGLPLVERRPVQLARLDPAAARALFVRDGFIGGRLPKKTLAQVPLIAENLQAIARVRSLEERGRRRDLMISEEELHAYVEERLPSDVLDAATLLRWWRGASEPVKQVLRFTDQVLLRQQSEGLGEDAYPSELTFGDVRLDVKYRFAPGAPDDGVNLQVPVGMLQGLAPEALEWMVPGLLPQVVEGWLRTLPKQRRRQISPIADRVPEVVAYLLRAGRYRRGRFASALGEAVAAVCDIAPDPGEWHPERLDDVLRMNIQVLGRKRRVIDSGRNLIELQDRHAADAASQEIDLSQPVQQSIEHFPDKLEAKKTLGTAKSPVLVYPALRDAGTTVDLVYAETEQRAMALNRAGFARMALQHLGSACRYFRREIDRNKTLGLHFASLGDAAALRDGLLCYVAWVCYFHGRPLPRARDAFESRMQERRAALASVFEACVDAFAQALAARFALMTALDSARSPAFAQAVADIRRTVDRLMPADVLVRADPELLLALPRYLAAQRYRLDNLQGKVQRDAEHVARMQGLEARLVALTDHRLTPPAEGEALALQLEEVRVALFAEPLAAKGLGSVKKWSRAAETLERQVGLL